MLYQFNMTPQEGHGLVRARHPGSAKIEEFLGQLEGLWEELRRRHQRNAVFLQASEELGFKVKIIKYRRLSRTEASHLTLKLEGRFMVFIFTSLIGRACKVYPQNIWYILIHKGVIQGL